LIDQVSKTLVDVIQQASPDKDSWVKISSLSAADSAPTVNTLAVALYAVEEHPHLRNRPPVNTAQGYLRPPVALRLRYLMTYWGPHEEAQARLARVIAVFATTPIIGKPQMTPLLAAEVETITVRLMTTTADERFQIWGALGRNARLSLFYEVDVAPVNLIARDGSGTITAHRIDYVSSS
jgi:hypothetical protein